MKASLVLAGIIFTLMLVAAFEPLVDEVNAIGTHENATSYDVILYNYFPPLYAIMILCIIAGTLIAVFKS